MPFLVAQKLVTQAAKKGVSIDVSSLLFSPFLVSVEAEKRDTGTRDITV
jgi:hypothetical protein